MKITKTKSRFSQIALSLVFAISFSACALRDPHFALLAKSQSGLISGLNNNKVDILWVIDNSGSMGPKQTNLANSINSFMSQFTSKQLDYQIGVVTTDLAGQGACLVGATKIITPSTVNGATVLASNANVGFFGASNAQPIDVAKTALSAPNTTGCNAGFLRDGAFLAIIMFSDADDNDSVTTPTGLINFLDTVKPPQTTSGGAVVRSYFISAMATLDAADAASPNCIASEISVKLLELSSLTSGVNASICSSDFSAGLLSVSTQILEATAAIRLSSAPDTSTINVYINGIQIAQDASNGWTFTSSTNTIYLHGNAIPTGSGIPIIVNYKPNDIVR